MYFTIENPDIKLMEELEYSKRVAEKSKSETINTLNNIKNELDEPLNQIVNFNDKKIITSTKEELIKEVKNLRIFTTSFADRVFSLIELGKVNSGDYMLNEEMYNTYGMINELEKKYLKYGYVDYIIKPLMDKDVSVILKKYLK